MLLICCIMCWVSSQSPPHSASQRDLLSHPSTGAYFLTLPRVLNFSPFHGCLNSSPFHRCLNSSPFHRCLKSSPFHRCLKSSPFHRCLKTPPFHRCLQFPPLNGCLNSHPSHGGLGFSKVYHEAYSQPPHDVYFHLYRRSWFFRTLLLLPTHVRHTI
jgi:hypothetical protein